MEKLLNPSWIKPSMTLSKAANQAALRGYVLHVSWTGTMGLRVVAERRERTNGAKLD